MLTDWLLGNNHSVLSLISIGGMGKTALSWVWALQDVLGFSLSGTEHEATEASNDHHVSELTRPMGVMWWSFYEPGATFPAFIDEALVYATSGTAILSDYSSTYEKLKALIDVLQGHCILIILDGFERILRAYQTASKSDESTKIIQKTSENEKDKNNNNDEVFGCADPRAADFLLRFTSLPTKSHLLLTSRHFPNELKSLSGVQQVILSGINSEDAVQFFYSQGIKGTKIEIQRACEPYGYHPLSLRLLAGVIVKDKEAPCDIKVAEKYSVLPNLKGKEQHHIFQIAYHRLKRQERVLLSHIAAFRGPIDYNTLLTLKPFLINTKRFDAGLSELTERGLLFCEMHQSRYDFHPVVRKYAYEQLSRIQRRLIHNRLRQYFADRSIQINLKELRGPDGLRDFIEYYHHTVQSGRYSLAYKIIHDQLFELLHYKFGNYLVSIELLKALFPYGDNKIPHLSKRLKKTRVRALHTGTAFPEREGLECEQVWALNALGISYRASGFPRSAVPLFELANSISEKLNDKSNLVVGLINLADVRWTIGAFESVEKSLREQIRLCKEIKDEVHEIVGHQDLGLRLAFMGRWEESDNELNISLDLARKKNDLHRQSIIWAHRSRKELLFARGEKALASQKAAVEKALTAATTTSKMLNPDQRERHYVRVCWLLGAANLGLSKLDEAELYLNEALLHCRSINLVEFEADILLEMARLKETTGKHSEAIRIVDEVLIITERGGYVLPAADAHLFLAQIEKDDVQKKRMHAERAYALAICDGPPDYTYKIVYHEAAALLNQLL